MMLRILSVVASVVIAAGCGFGEGFRKIDWDLSTDNRIALVDWPQSEISDIYILEEPLDLAIQFPTGFSVRERARRFICKRPDPQSDRLNSVRFHLTHCTTDEAYAKVKAYITSWKLQKFYSTDRVLQALDEWRAAARRGRGETFLAARHENYPIIDVEIHHSFDEGKPWFISIYFSVAQPPLADVVVVCFEAIRTGDAATYQKILNDGLAVDAVDVNGDSLLHQAAEYGREKLVVTLLDRGAAVDAAGPRHETPFRQAVLYGQLEIARRLLDRGADINHGAGGRGTVLHYAAEYTFGPLPNDRQAQWLLEQGAAVNAVDREGDTPLHKAAWKGHTAAAMVLLAAGANAEAANAQGQTPVDHAVTRGQVELERLLRQSSERAKNPSGA